MAALPGLMRLRLPHQPPPALPITDQEPRPHTLRGRLTPFHRGAVPELRPRSHVCVMIPLVLVTLDLRMIPLQLL
ncbi:Hypothetical predicted protein [Scomber scombrus]|uniref:Uncharacterized protein n=1 Tax=Scomber scombrus TaxID=13677 RepID=A0AAV1MSN8_SCOSC